MFERKAGLVAIFFTKTRWRRIVENVSAMEIRMKKDEIGPFDGDLLEDGLRPIDTSEQAEGSDEGFDWKRKKDNCWHSFKTP